MRKFEHTFVKNTEDRKGLNIPKVNGSEGMLFAACAELYTEMNRLVDNERNRALGAELEVGTEATKKFQWMNDYVDEWHDYSVVEKKEYSLPDENYIYEVTISCNNENYSYPIPFSDSGKSFLCIVDDNVELYVFVNGGTVVLSKPISLSPFYEIRIVDANWMMNPRAYAKSLFDVAKARIDSLEARVANLERRI